MAQQALLATLVTAGVAGAVVATAATPPLAHAAARTTPRALAAVAGVRSSCHTPKASTVRHYRCVYQNGRWHWSVIRTGRR
jgi:hypothetical protein